MKLLRPKDYKSKNDLLTINVQGFNVKLEKLGVISKRAYETLKWLAEEYKDMIDHSEGYFGFDYEDLKEDINDVTNITLLNKLKSYKLIVSDLDVKCYSVVVDVMGKETAGISNDLLRYWALDRKICRKTTLSEL